MKNVLPHGCRVVSWKWHVCKRRNLTLNHDEPRISREGAPRNFPCIDFEAGRDELCTRRWPQKRKIAAERVNRVPFSLSLSLSLCPRVSVFSCILFPLFLVDLFGSSSEAGSKNYRCYRIGAHDNGTSPGRKSVFARPIRCAATISRGREHTR